MAVSAGEPLAAKACGVFYARLLRLEPGVEAILETAKVFPEEPAVRLACGFLWLFGQTPEAQGQAEVHLAAAEKFAGRLSARERAWLGAMRRWHGREFEAAALAYEAITAEWPEDLPAVKAAEFIYYILGQQASGARFLGHLERVATVHGGDADFLAMKAFAHELCGETQAARDVAERALEVAPFNPWAQHALEHAMLWEGSQDEAIARMEGWLGTWDRAGRIIHCHNAWHVALTRLDRLEVERAWAVYDGHVWGISPGFVVEQLDAIAFLWRAEMAGVEVETGRYKEIVPHIAPLAETLFMPFVTAHYTYALARAGERDAVEAVLAKVDERAGRDDVEARWAWNPVGRSVIHATAALGRGEGREAADLLDPVMDRVTRVGGSDAQDDLFRFAHYDSLRRAGRKADARALLERRLAQKRPSPLEERLRGELG